jgi:hypothetical protein
MHMHEWVHVCVGGCIYVCVSNSDGGMAVKCDFLL